jgi:hypothetical protein
LISRARRILRNGRRLAKALADERSGLIKMLPPTMSILIELADLVTVAEVINHATDRKIEPVLPRLLETESGWQFRYPRTHSSETSS